MTNDLTRYLLGDVSEEERADLEQKYFADDDLFEQLIEAQDDLADEYAAGTLTAAQRRQFEERFLKNEAGAENVKFARTLRDYVSPSRADGEESGRWRYAIAASILLVVTLGGIWLFRAEQPRPSAPPVARKQQPVPPPAAPAREVPLVTLLLTPGSTREDATQPLELRQAPQVVRLELVVENDRFDSYRAELQDVEGRRLWEQNDLHAQKKTAVMNVPAKLLPPGDYIVLLHGVRNGSDQEIGNYAFTVVARAVSPSK